MAEKSFEQQAVETVRTLWVWCIVLSCFLVLALGVAIFAVANGYGAISRVDVTAHRGNATANRVAAVAAGLTAERNQTILRECAAQNERHTATLHELDAEVRKVGRHLSGAQAKQLRASKRFTVLLIDRLAPYANCQKQLALDTSK